MVGFAVAATFLALLLLLAREAARQVVHAKPLLRLTLGAAGLFGLALGAIALLLGPVAARIRPGEMLMPGRWWDVDAQALLTERLPPASHALVTALTLPLEAMPLIARLLAGIAVLSAAIAVAVLATIMRRKSAGLAMMAAFVALALAAAGALFLPAATVLGLWIVGRLNFWLFAVMGIGFQFYRRAA
jgi:hypothetical protein